MTPERLALLRCWHVGFGPIKPVINELVAEIDRLRGVVAAYEQAYQRERERAEIYGR